MNILESFNLSKSLETVYNKLLNWTHELILALPNFVVAILVFVVFYFVARYAAMLIDRIVRRQHIQRSVQNLIHRGVKIVIIGVGFFIALGLLNLDKALTSILAGAGVLGLAIGFALQGTLKNTVSGIILSFLPEVKIHDWIETDKYAGEVLEVDLRNIHIREADNNHVIIPNSVIVDGSFKNFTSTRRSRVMVD